MNVKLRRTAAQDRDTMEEYRRWIRDRYQVTDGQIHTRGLDDPTLTEEDRRRIVSDIRLYEARPHGSDMEKMQYFRDYLTTEYGLTDGQVCLNGLDNPRMAEHARRCIVSELRRDLEHRAALMSDRRRHGMVGELRRTA